MSGNEQMKRAAALRAVEWIRDGMVLGLGSGSTAALVLEEIASRRSQGVWKNVVGVPTSERTAELARGHGIPLIDLGEGTSVDLAIDGADEVDVELNLIKGLGGALLREKIVATVAAVVLIVVDDSKRVSRLGTKCPVPVEVDPFGVAVQEPFFRALGADPRLRHGEDGAPVRTDGGNYIIDCHFPDGIEDAHTMEVRLKDHPGILEAGLFIDLADHVLIGTPSGVEVQSRGDPRP